jgi:hypothetical protein
MLLPLFEKIWEQEEIPTDWKDGHIIKLPKKGDLSSCEKDRGITLLSAPGKVFNRILLGRMRDAVDVRLRDHQVGFRQDRSCTDQIATLRIIVEQSLEWNSSLYVNFVDFRKAFDSLHRDTMWQLLRHYGIPAKLIQIIEESYTYLGSVINQQGGTDADVKTRIGEARASYKALKNIWQSHLISFCTKIRLFNYNVKSVLLYGAEPWRTTNGIVNKVQTFINSCVRGMLVSYHQQHRSLGENQSSASRRRDQKKKMAMDWTHPEKTTDKHHSPGPDLEPSGEEKEGPAQELLEKGPGGILQADRLLLGGGGSYMERIANNGGRLWMAYAPPGAQGLSKKDLF